MSDETIGGQPLPPGTSVATALALLHQQVGHLVRHQQETDRKLERMEDRQQEAIGKMQRSVDAVPEIVRQVVTAAVDDLRAEVVSREAFMPVQRVVYGLVGLVLVTTLGVLLSLVMRQGGIQ
jgi:hypothetical protein